MMKLKNILKGETKRKPEIKEAAETTFDVTSLDTSDLVEYDYVLDDILAILKKYKWIKGLQNSVVAKQTAHDKKLVADTLKKKKDGERVVKSLRNKKK